MRRALLTLGGTAAGLAALLSFKTHSLAATAAAAPPAPPSASAGMTPPPGAAAGSPSPRAGQQGGATAKGSGTPKAGGSGQAGGAGKPSAGQPAAARTVTGAVASTQYGPMQVQLTLAGTKITKVSVLQRTDDGAESDEIDGAAIPRLTAETLAAQSARVDAVSGATYTSSGYIKSLQSALDQAGA
jgi:uncharacterized protein with FMN-binding domain